VDARTIVDLQALAHTAFETADQFELGGEAEAAIVYQRLRSRAWTLNRVQGWADSEEFDAMFPTLEAQEAIEAMDAHYGIDTAKANEPGASVQRLLRNLAAWAAGLLIATNLGDDEAGTEGVKRK
jgi:hypothetical protein